jgi:hypothetical protein
MTPISGLRSLPLAAIGVVALAAYGCGNSTGMPGTVGDGPTPGTVGVALQRVASGLDLPLFVTAPPGDPRVFIVEKAGRIRIVESGALRPTPFLDLTTLVSAGAEQGLLGLAFHPAYAQNGLFVVDYTDQAGNTQVVTYKVSTDPNVADPATAHVILSVPQPFANHNGGEVTFGPDGDLYIGLGDGGSEGDPQGHGQDRTELLGSLLRISVNADGAGYTAPADNPFVGQSGARAELWNVGLRNPWRFSFDRATGELYIADVGQSAFEEVNVLPAGDRGGENFGWNIMEGMHCYAASSCDRSGLTLPVIEYGHDAGCSITGGYVYRGAAITALPGTYFYADYCSGFVRSFRWHGGAVTEEHAWPTLAPGSGITSFGEDAGGELYLTAVSGDVYRIVPAAATSPAGSLPRATRRLPRAH